MDELTKAINYCDNNHIPYCLNENRKIKDDITIYINSMSFNCLTVQDIKDAVNF